MKYPVTPAQQACWIGSVGNRHTYESVATRSAVAFEPIPTLVAGDLCMPVARLVGCDACSPGELVTNGSMPRPDGYVRPGRWMMVSVPSSQRQGTWWPGTPGRAGR